MRSDSFPNGINIDRRAVDFVPPNDGSTTIMVDDARKSNSAHIFCRNDNAGR